MAGRSTPCPYPLSPQEDRVSQLQQLKQQINGLGQSRPAPARGAGQFSAFAQQSAGQVQATIPGVRAESKDSSYRPPRSRGG